MTRRVADTDVAALRRCLDEDGIVLFGADTVYGLACDPSSEAAVRRLYGLKGRRPDKPAAVMWFDAQAALSDLDLGKRTLDALDALLPGPLTALVPNPQRIYPLACGPDPVTLGVRVPRLAEPLSALTTLDRPLLQTSANRAGDRAPRRVGEVEASIRRGLDLELDAGELPGTASTVVDLTAYEAAGEWRVVRQGALSAERLGRALSSIV